MCHNDGLGDSNTKRRLTEHELDLLDELLALDDRVFEALVVGARLLRARR